jgi:hypothetical protein
VFELCGAHYAQHAVDSHELLVSAVPSAFLLFEARGSSLSMSLVPFRIYVCILLLLGSLFVARADSSFSLRNARFASFVCSSSYAHFLWILKASHWPSLLSV